MEVVEGVDKIGDWGVGEKMGGGKEEGVEGIMEWDGVVIGFDEGIKVVGGMRGGMVREEEVGGVEVGEVVGVGGKVVGFLWGKWVE